MKKILLIMMVLSLLSFSAYSAPGDRPPPPPIERLSVDEIDFHEEELEEMMEYYGYDAFVMFDFDKRGPFLYIETEGEYSHYEHTTFIITVVRALLKYSEYYEFIFSRYITRIDFISGEIESELLREDFAYAADIVNSKDQGEFLNEQRSLK